MKFDMKLRRHRNLRNLSQHSLYAHARRGLVRMPVCVVLHVLADPGVGSGGSSPSHNTMVVEGLASGNLLGNEVPDRFLGFRRPDRR